VLTLDSINYLNATLEIIGAVIALTVIISLVADRDSRSRLGRVFLYLLICNGAGLIFDAPFWVFVGRPGWCAGMIARISVFATFTIGYVFVPLFIAYILTLAGQTKLVSNRILYISTAVCAAAILSVVVSLFTHMYTYFDERNNYYRGPLFAFSQAILILFAAVAAAVIIYHRKALGVKNTAFLLSYTGIVSAALIAEKFLSGLSLVGIATSFSLFVIYAGIQRKQTRLLRERELELAESRVTVMLSQIQPHFLYNTLTVIKHLCRSDPALAEETVVEFSSYLRGNLDSISKKAPIPFAHELMHVETYLALEKKRFGSRLSIAYDIRARDFFVPALSLQPIVENALRHGIMKREQGGTLTIAAEETDGDYRVTVTDDGVGFDPGKPKQDGRSHVGIENTRARLAAMCGESLTIRSEKDAGTTAVISIPKGGS